MDKTSIEEYTETEFLQLITDIFDANGSEKQVDKWVQHFNSIVAHPDKSDLIFYPSDDREDSPEGVINELKRWYSENNLLCFKE